jgi:hypothetical protein
LAYAEACSTVGAMTTIEPGARVLARDVLGALLERRALSRVEVSNGHQIVWVCKEDEWIAAQTEERTPEGFPWPAEDVELVGEEAVA